MPERRGPHVYTIPTHHGFADALAAGLIRRYGGDPLALARGLVLQTATWLSSLGHVAYLVCAAAAGTWLAVRTLRGRLQA